MAGSSQLQNHPLLSQAGRSADGRPAPAVAPEASSVHRMGAALRPLRDLRLLLSALFAMAALVGLGLGWYEVSGTSDVYAQLPYFFSFGGTVLALMLAAAALFIDYEHSCDRQGIALLLERLETIEEQMSAGRDVALPGTTRPETAER